MQSENERQAVAPSVEVPLSHREQIWLPTLEWVFWGHFSQLLLFESFEKKPAGQGMHRSPIFPGASREYSPGWQGVFCGFKLFLFGAEVGTAEKSRFSPLSVGEADAFAGEIEGFCDGGLDGIEDRLG